MRPSLKFLLIFLLLLGLGAAAVIPIQSYLKEKQRPIWQTQKAIEGEIISVVNSTGTVKPVVSVEIGSFVSGPITELHVEFNQEVKSGDLLALIDPRLYEASVARDKATLLTRQADIARASALLQQAVNNEQRKKKVREANENFVAEAEWDQIRFNRMSLEAQLEVAKAAVAQAQANLQNSELNLEYTKIKSPVDGIIIDRKIDPGQTLAAQFQTPVLFVVGERMREEMHIFAAVDEADIGFIRKAQEKNLPAQFRVDAYPDELFEGLIKEVRFSSTETQNVITYPVLVSAPNPELKLLPGMTATITFKIDESKQVIKVPNAALRFYPESKYVREEDQALLDGTKSDNTVLDGENQESEAWVTDNDKLRQQRNRRHVWVVDGETLRAIEIVTGMTDNRFTEIISGDLKTDDELVIGSQFSLGAG